MGVKDANLMLLDSYTITTSYSTAGKLIYGTPIKGAAIEIDIPARPSGGSVMTVLPKVWVSADNSTYYLLSTYPTAAVTIPAGGLELHVPFIVENTEGKYVKLELITAGTTPNLGLVNAGYVVSKRGVNRETHFE